jgi:hypothetical protein
VYVPLMATMSMMDGLLVTVGSPPLSSVHSTSFS